MDATTTRPRRGDSGRVEAHDTVIVGGGQAGLTMGHELATQGRDFVILDAFDRVGEAWRRRWDSLRLNTPARYDGLPGLRLSEDGLAFPTKDEFAEYLERYVHDQGLPVRTGTRIARLERDGDGYLLTSDDGRRFAAANVVIATGPFQVPKVPDFARELATAIVSLHSSEYRSPAELAPGPVLVVGFGNSASEIAIEVSRTHETAMSGAPHGELPVRHGRAAARFVFPVVRFVGLHVANERTPMGRAILSRAGAHGDPLIRVRRRELAAAGVRFVPRTTGIEHGRPVAGDEVLDVANVIWCTGHGEDFGWVHLPGFEQGGRPPHHRGVVEGLDGVYLLGLDLLFALGSGTLVGVGRDARYLASRLPTAGGTRRARHDEKAPRPSVAVAR